MSCDMGNSSVPLWAHAEKAFRSSASGSAGYESVAVERDSYWLKYVLFVGFLLAAIFALARRMFAAKCLFPVQFLSSRIDSLGSPWVLVVVSRGLIPWVCWFTQETDLVDFRSLWRQRPLVVRFVEAEEVRCSASCLLGSFSAMCRLGRRLRPLEVSRFLGLSKR